MKRVFVWALSAMVAIAVVGLAIAVQSNDSTPIDSTVVDVSDQQTVDEGTRALMEFHQVTSLAELQQVQEWQSELPAVLESLTATAGNRFATAFVEQSPDWKLVIRIAGDTVPSVLANAVTNAPIPVEVRTDARHTAVQLDAIVSAVSADLSDIRAQVYVRNETGAIVVAFYTGQAIDYGAIESALQSKYDVEFEFGSVTITSLANIRGGPRQWVFDLGSQSYIAVCTYGFSVWDYLGGKGVTTAGHCPAGTYHAGFGSTRPTYYWYNGNAQCSWYDSCMGLLRWKL